jgi:uroporphyrinogen III methyltransferase/synthase
MKDRPRIDKKRVLAVCSPMKAETLVPALEALGATVEHFQALEIRELADCTLLDSALDRLDRYDWLVFTSAYGVDFFARRLRRPLPPTLRVCAIGPATASRARECGLRIDLVPEQYVAEGVVAALSRFHENTGLEGKRILLPRAKEARDVIPAEFSAAGAEVDVAPCYETIRAQASPQTIARIRKNQPDLIVFTSSSGVSNFVSLAGKETAYELLRAATVAVIGPVTARTLESLGRHADIVPPESTIVSLVESIRRWIAD